MNSFNVKGPLDKDWIISLLAEGYDTYYIVKNYKLSEDVILDSHEFLDKKVIIEGITLTEDFINKAIEIGYFTIEDIKELNMSSYANFSLGFIVRYKEQINWTKMMIYFSTQSDNFDNYVGIIEENNLWSVISANDLSVEFIRKWKDKLDWKYLSIVKCFSEEETIEFKDYITIPEREPVGDFIDNSQFEFVSKMTTEELEQLIEEVNKHLGKN